MIGVDKVPESVGGLAFFENVHGGTHPVAAYEAVGYRGGDVFIDHETTRQSTYGNTYPVYEILTQAQFAEKYPTDVPDPMPATEVHPQYARSTAEKERSDSFLTDRDGWEPRTRTLDRAFHGTLRSMTEVVMVK